MDPETIYLISVLSVLAGLMLVDYFIKRKEKLKKRIAPSPPSWPVIGHLHLLAPYKDNPWEGFNAIRSKFGDIVSLQLGSRKTVMVSNRDLMKEVLMTQGEIFADRPDFKRYHLIFNGDRENSLALCNWSKLQQTRREVAKIGILPRYSLLEHLDTCIQYEILEQLLNGQQLDMVGQQKPLVERLLTKEDILFTCSNIFTNYLCSKRFDRDTNGLKETLYHYDWIFSDINYCGPVDFLPWITKLGIGKSYMNHIVSICSYVRDFMEGNVIRPRLDKYKESRAKMEKLEEESDTEIDALPPTLDLDTKETPAKQQKDFLDVSLEHHLAHPKSYPWDVSVYEVMDLIGGHSAVGNLLYRLLGWVAIHPEAQERIYREAVAALEADEEADGRRIIKLSHRTKMPFTDSSILETLRLASSPIVPHVANRSTTLSGFDVEEGTMILFNTYHLNMSEDYWKCPREFRPERFLVQVPVVADGLSKGIKYCPSSSSIGSNDNSDSNVPNVIVDVISGTINNNSIKDDIDELVTATNGQAKCVKMEECKGEEKYWNEKCILEPGNKFQVSKPDHFFPFSFGRRACLGYKMVTFISFSILANLCLNYKLVPVDADSVKLQLTPKGSLALSPDDCYKIDLVPRKSCE